MDGIRRRIDGASGTAARGLVRRFAVFAAVAVITAGCGSDAPRRHHGPPPIVFSPNGEPLSGGPLGRVVCRDAIGRWFDRVDANGDGILTFDEFEADARHQFAAMDTDSDGYVTPPELAAMRAPYRPTDTTSPVLVADPQSPQAVPPGRQGGGRRGEREGRGERRRSPGSRPVDDGSIDQADPVMSADTNVDFRVSLAEFLAQAHRVYARLDTGADGRPTRVEAVTGICGDEDNAERNE